MAQIIKNKQHTFSTYHKLNETRQHAKNEKEQKTKAQHAKDIRFAQQDIGSIFAQSDAVCSKIDKILSPPPKTE